MYNVSWHLAKTRASIKNARLVQISFSLSFPPLGSSPMHVHRVQYQNSESIRYSPFGRSPMERGVLTTMYVPLSFSDLYN